jgi:cysteine synthase
MGTSRFLKEVNPSVQIIGVQPAEGASIPGIRLGLKIIYLKFLIQMQLIA